MVDNKGFCEALCVALGCSSRDTPGDLAVRTELPAETEGTLGPLPLVGGEQLGNERGAARRAEPLRVFCTSQISMVHYERQVFRK